MSAPMLPELPLISRCPGCRHLFWLAEAPDGKRRGELVENLDEDGFFEALALGLGDTPEHELHLRVKAWQRGNDRVRARTPALPDRDEREEANLIALLTALDPASHTGLAAEVARQLGRFDQAREWLDGLPLEARSPALDHLRTLVDAGDRRLDEFPMADSHRLARHGRVCPRCGACSRRPPRPSEWTLAVCPSCRQGFWWRRAAAAPEPPPANRAPMARALQRVGRLISVVAFLGALVADCESEPASVVVLLLALAGAPLYLMQAPPARSWPDALETDAEVVREMIAASDWADTEEENHLRRVLEQLHAQG